MGKDAIPSHAREAVLSLDDNQIVIEWQAPPSEDVLARLLLELVGEDTIKEIFDDK